MAEKQEGESVFASVMRAIKRGRKDNTAVTNQRGIITGAPDPSKGPFTSYQQKQQEFLDVQSHKIAQDLYSRSMYYETDRLSAYMDYKSMDMSPEVSVALDIISDEMVTKSERGEVLSIYSDNTRVKNVLHDLFYNVLNVGHNLGVWARELVKYGDLFLRLEIDQELGIYDVRELPVNEIHREEAWDGNTNSARFRWDTNNMYFEDFQVGHFRLISDTSKLPYGRSILDPARKLWKQLQLAEDAMLVYRLVRAPERRIFFIEVGNIDPADVGQYIEKAKAQIKKSPMVDPSSGNINLKYNPMSYEEDFFLPVRGDKSSRIETLPGACLALDTKIELLDGRSLSLEGIIKEYDTGKQLWSYSINPQTGEIVPGKITWAGITRKNTDVVKITLDNGETITCTPDHKFPTRFNGEKEAKDLQVGESMWAFNKQFKPVSHNTKEKRTDYEMIFNHYTKKWVFTHRMVANYFKALNEHETFVYSDKNKDLKKSTIHHKDFNSDSNNPNNLCFMNSLDHYEFHQQLVLMYQPMATEAWRVKYNSDIDFRNTVLKRLEEIRIYYYDNRTEEQELEHNLAISNGLKEFINNLTDEEKIKRAETITAGITEESRNKAVETFKNNPNRAEIILKASAKSKITKNLPENKKRYSANTKKLWENIDFVESVIAPQRRKYDIKMLSIITDIVKKGNTQMKDIFPVINNPEHEFYKLFFQGENANNKQLIKKSFEVTYDNFGKMLTHFGYADWKEFKNKAPYFNHKIVSVEFLTEKMDTGTLTIDGQEQYHGFHNFALSCGIFTKNSNLDAISDIEYLQNKLFAALKVPKPYLNYAESIPGGSALSQADLRFSRTINRLQEFMVMELRRIAKVHLYFLGFEDDIENFTLSLTNPSTQQELLKLETMKARLEVFKEMFTTDVSSPTSYTWAMQNIMGFSEAEVKQMLRQKKIERKMFSEIEGATVEYKETGIFNELDKKFRRPDFDPSQLPAAGAEDGADAGGSGGGGGGFGGGSSLTGMGGGMGDAAGSAGGAGEAGGMDMGGEMPGAGGGTPEEAGAEVPEEAGAAPVSETNTLLKKNAVLNHKTKKLLENMERFIKKSNEKEIL